MMSVDVVEDGQQNNSSSHTESPHIQNNGHQQSEYVDRKRGADAMLHDASPDANGASPSDVLDAKRQRVSDEAATTELKPQSSACTGADGISVEPSPQSRTGGSPTQPEPLTTNGPEGKTVALNAEATISHRDHRMDSDSLEPTGPPSAASPHYDRPHSSDYDEEVMEQTDLDITQLRFCDKVLKNSKRLKDAPPFLQPVDPVKLGIPTYFDVIKKPMDISTIQQKLNSNVYRKQSEFMDDLNLMFSNCYLFNGRESFVGKMAQKLEQYFNNQMKNLPHTAEGLAQTKKKVPSSSEIHRPKRDTHAPSRDLPIISPVPKKNLSKQALSDLKFAVSLVREIKSKHFAISYPFLVPVDPIKLNIPTYPLIIKNPMDFGTVLKKLEASAYASGEEFLLDARLIFRNCYTFNAPDSDVCELCRRVESIFEERWKKRPVVAAPSKPKPPKHVASPAPSLLPAKPPTPTVAPPPLAVPPSGQPPTIATAVSEDESDSDDSDEDSESEIDINKILTIMNMKHKVSQLLRKKKKKEKEREREKDRDRKSFKKEMRKKAKSKEKEREREREREREKDRTSMKSKSKSKRDKQDKSDKHNAERHKSSAHVKPSPSSTPVETVRDITYAEKQELSEKIGDLDPDKLESVYQIIRSGLPNLDTEAAGQEEIELDIDSLDRVTLFRLYQFVHDATTKPAKSKAVAPPSTSSRKEEAKAKSRSGSVATARDLSSSGSESSDSDSGSDNENQVHHISTPEASSQSFGRTSAIEQTIPKQISPQIGDKSSTTSVPQTQPSSSASSKASTPNVVLPSNKSAAAKTTSSRAPQQVPKKKVASVDIFDIVAGFEQKRRLDLIAEEKLKEKQREEAQKQREKLREMEVNHRRIPLDKLSEDSRRYSASSSTPGTSSWIEGRRLSSGRVEGDDLHSSKRSHASVPIYPLDTRAMAEIKARQAEEELRLEREAKYTFQIDLLRQGTIINAADELFKAEIEANAGFERELFADKLAATRRIEAELGLSY
ncbi:hypothetical protein DFJ73DRAFT_806491 [Zopfochytrium polystomum]|nr:hypothetical protein DFJ73DRAFT_806491 [Zopfochytrium polystomum]